LGENQHSYFNNKKENAPLSSKATGSGIITEGVGWEFDDDLKTLILWIYNINQNGTGNAFKEEISKYFTGNGFGSLSIKDLSKEDLAKFFNNLSTAKEIKLPDLGLRLLLLIYNCNQNGSANLAEIANPGIKAN
jgi:hypothetical protein